jgi:hypothetical protein
MVLVHFFSGDSVSNGAVVDTAALNKTKQIFGHISYMELLTCSSLFNRRYSFVAQVLCLMFVFLVAGKC